MQALMDKEGELGARELVAATQATLAGSAPGSGIAQDPENAVWVESTPAGSTITHKSFTLPDGSKVTESETMEADGTRTSSRISTRTVTTMITVDSATTLDAITDEAVEVQGDEIPAHSPALGDEEQEGSEDATAVGHDEL